MSNHDEPSGVVPNGQPLDILALGMNSGTSMVSLTPIRM